MISFIELLCKLNPFYISMIIKRVYVSIVENSIVYYHAIKRFPENYDINVRCLQKYKFPRLYRYDETDHAPVLKATMLMCTTKHGLMTPRRRWPCRIDTPTRTRLVGHANATGGRHYTGPSMTSPVVWNMVFTEKLTTMLYL